MRRWESLVKFSDIIDSGRIAAGGMKDLATGLVHPSLRIGVTGLARSGKTVFITALVHALLHRARLPLFDAQAQGRIRRAYLEPQPNDELPRFAFEDHVAALTGADRHWPESTRQLSQLRLTLDYEPRGLLARHFGSGRLHLDIIDYPGEWLLDLPLMSLSYAEWSTATFAASRKHPRDALAKDWHGFVQSLDASGPVQELHAVKAAALFTEYLSRCRRIDVSLSTLPPGRFLMPGDLAGSPLLTFAPLDLETNAKIPAGSLASLMERRYRSYVSKVVKPFFYDHFARLDRQIVLIDALAALNAGAAAVQDLRVAMTGVLSCFRQGANSWSSALFGRRISRIVFAAAKADLLHHTSHDRLEGILKEIVAEAATRAEFSGAEIDVVALAAIRATREATIKEKGETLSCIAGFPEAGETIGGESFDGSTEAAVFPGDLPDDPRAALTGELEGALKFVKFRPPHLAGATLPHIRLDRTMEFLIGDSFA
jgi:predicted YcjX-like family ATPase